MFKLILNLIRKPLAAALFAAVRDIPVATDAALFQQAVLNEISRVLGVPAPPPA